MTRERQAGCGAGAGEEWSNQRHPSSDSGTMSSTLSQQIPMSRSDQRHYLSPAMIKSSNAELSTKVGVGVKGEDLGGLGGFLPKKGKRHVQ